MFVVHGKWSQWTDLNSCSETCGGGIKSSKRVCDNPAPKNMGNICEGNARTDTKECNDQNCPGTKYIYSYV